MIIDLNTYIKIDEIRRELRKSCIQVSNTDEAKTYAFSLADGTCDNVIFEKSSLKTFCFSEIKKYMDVDIINCNSSEERFIESVNNANNFLIFDNVNLCKNIHILNMIREKKGILVC